MRTWPTLNLAGQLPQDAVSGFRLISAHAVAVTSVVLAAGAIAGDASLTPAQDFTSHYRS